MKSFYISRGLFFIGYSAISIFIPIFFFEKKLHLWEIFSFYSIDSLVHAVLVRKCAAIAFKRGVVVLFFLGIVLYAAFFLGVRLVELAPLWLVSLAIIHGIAGAFYWTAYHLFLASRWTSSGGMQLGYLKNIAGLASIVGPAIGAVIIAYAGFPTLFALASVVMLASILPLIREPSLLSGACPEWGAVWRGRRKSDVVAFAFGVSAEYNMQVVVWPIYTIAISGFSIILVGFTYSVAFVVIAIVTQMVAWAVARKPGYILVIGALGNAFLNCFRALGLTASGNVVPVTLTAEVLTTSSNITMDSICYDRAKVESDVSYILFREISINAGGVLFFLMCAVAQRFWVVFLISAAASLTYLLFVPRKERVSESVS